MRLLFVIFFLLLNDVEQYRVLEHGSIKVLAIVNDTTYYIPYGNEYREYTKVHDLSGRVKVLEYDKSTHKNYKYLFKHTNGGFALLHPDTVQRFTLIIDEDQ